MTAIWDQSAPQEKIASRSDARQDTVSKYTSKIMDGPEASQIFAPPQSDWSGSADSAVHPVHSLLGSIEDTTTAMSVTNAWESHSWNGTPSPLSAQSIISQRDSCVAEENGGLTDMPSHHRRFREHQHTGTSPVAGSGSDTSTSPVAGSGSDTSTSPVAGSGSDTSTSPAAGSTTSPPPEQTPPTATTPPEITTSPGTGSSGSAIGPAGETVGSTAADFGIGAMPSAAQAAPGYYVAADASGNGTGDLGSATNPFSTLQQAQQAMENSDIKTTYVEGGTYNMSSTLNLTSADSGESFIGIGGSSDPATLDGGGSLSSLIAINGANTVTVEGLSLQNTAQGQVWNNLNSSDAISVSNSTGDNFSYNTVSNVGVAVVGGLTNSEIVGNDINNVQTGIFMWPGADSNTIDSNNITNVSNNTGIINDNIGAIELAGASGTELSNNVIENTAGGGIELTNYGGTSPNNDSIVGNTVENTNTAAIPSSTYDASATNPSDMGAIYVWQGAGQTDNTNLTIANNYVQNAGQGFENVGIYLDDGVNGATVTRNVVQAGGSGWDMLVHGGSNDTIQDNVLDLTSSTGSEKGMLYQTDGPLMQNNVISDNIVYANGTNGGAYTMYDNAGDQPTTANNDYWQVNPSGDSNPNTYDPQFVDPSNGDYQLEPGSPAVNVVQSS